jgi:methylamine dehydrogenase accessory protein MauD
MITALIVAVIVQWALLAVLSVIVFALLRQVGMLHERLGPVGALTLPGGPRVGDASPRFDLTAMDGRPVTIGGTASRSTLLFFLSPTCPICKSMLPVLKSLVAERAGSVELVLASDGDEPEQRAMILREGLAAYPFLLSATLGQSFQIGKLPYAVLIGPDGRLDSKGLVNNREHLESLFEAQSRGVASLQDYLKKNAPQKRSVG